MNYVTREEEGDPTKSRTWRGVAREALKWSVMGVGRKYTERGQKGA